MEMSGMFSEEIRLALKKYLREDFSAGELRVNPTVDLG
jgi:hypothetical protein